MTDFPRGWTLTSDAAGAATITVPAIAGVAHVLDAFSVKLVDATAATAASLVRLSSSDGTFNNLVLARLATAIPAAGSQESDSASGSDLGLVAGAGASITVALTASAGISATMLVIQGHDV